MQIIKYLLIPVMSLLPVKELDTFLSISSVVQVNNCYYMKVYPMYSIKRAIKICDWR